MSNRDLVGRFQSASTRRDFEQLEALIADDAVWDMSRSRGPEQGVYRGANEIRELFERLIDSWEELSFESLSAEEVGDCVVEAVHVKMTGVGSGVEIDAHGGRVYRFRDGQIVHFVMFQNVDDAKAYVDATQP